MSASSSIVVEPGNGTLEVFSVPAEERVLFPMLKDIFENYWDVIIFGSAVQGGIFEVRAPNAPEKIGMLDGYLTVDFGRWHFHLCIGEHKGTKRSPCPPELAKHRQTARAELYRRLGDDGVPTSWGFRMFNGADEQQMTVFLPSPFLSVEQKIIKVPQYENLALWDHLRQTYLGIAPEALDRAGKGFHNG
ncbi:MAG: hypothetical protein IT470_06795 [Pseudomonadales bacterium]|nr:hypothetical protein [Pseudomonadales bacterium]